MLFLWRYFLPHFRGNALFLAPIPPWHAISVAE
jgi:hypothetical protein